MTLTGACLNKRRGIAETWVLGALMADELPGSAQCGEVEGKYANYFQVGFNAFEFLLDFDSFIPTESRKATHPNSDGPVVCPGATQSAEQIDGAVRAGVGPIEAQE